MTDDDKALVERLEEWEWTLRAVYKAGDLGTDEPAIVMGEASDRIEALSAENERLREALVQIAKPCSVVVEPSGKAGECWKKMYYGWRKIAVDRVDIARAALGETK